MHSGVTLYKFKTPVFEYEKEINCIEKIYSNTKGFFDFQGVEYRENQEETEVFKNILFLSKNIEIVLSMSQNMDLYYLPLVILQINISQSLLESNRIKEVLESYFEIFDGIKESTYLIDLSTEIKKLHPHHDFVEKNELIKKYNNEERSIQLLKNFLSEKNISKTNFSKVEEIFIHFTFTVYLLYQNLYKIQQTQKENTNVLNATQNNEILGKSLSFCNQRLSHLEDINMVTFNKHITFLEQFYQIIS